MSKVVLHIGTHKTATTTLQDMFWENAPLLAEHALIYPRLGRVTGHHGLVYDWARLPPIYQLEEGSIGALEGITKQYADQDVTVFLSSEEFSRGDPNAAVDFAAIRESLAGFDEIEVICVLRQQWQFLQSIYLELSKVKSPVRPPKLLEPALQTGMTQGLWVDYNKILDQLEQVFAPQEITFMDFDTCCAANGGIIGAFLEHLVVDLSADDLTQVNGGASNVSPKPLAMWMANVTSEPYRAPVWLIKHTTTAIENECEKPIKGCLFTRTEFKEIKDHFAGLNVILQERRAPYQPDFKMAAPDITPFNLFRNTLPNAVWVRTTRQLALIRIKEEHEAAKE